MLTRNQHTEIIEETESYLPILGEFCLVSFILVPISIFQFEAAINLFHYLGFILAFAILGAFSPNLITIGARLSVSIALASIVGNLLVVQFLQEDIWLLTLAIFFSGILLLTVLFWEDLFKIFWIFAAISTISFMTYFMLVYFM